MKKILAFALFTATIPATNWLIGHVGQCIPSGPCIIPVGFGLVAPSGVLMIGIALVLRDVLQDLAGWKWAVVAIIAGALLSIGVSPASIALASAVAFGLAELADMAVYTPLRKRGKAFAVLASGFCGAVADSVLFLWVAFGSVEFAAGMIVGKVYASLAAAGFLTAIALRASRENSTVLPPVAHDGE